MATAFLHILFNESKVVAVVAHTTRPVELLHTMFVISKLAKCEELHEYGSVAELLNIKKINKPNLNK